MNEHIRPCSRSMRGDDNFISDSIIGLLDGGQPLESQRWPLHFMHDESVVKVPAILHPDLVLFLGGELRLLVHWREGLSNYNICL